MDPTVSPDGRAQLVTIVSNDGRQPATVGPVGFYWDVKGLLPHRPVGEVLFNDPWSRDFVGAKASVTYAWDVPPAPYVHLDCPLRAFADVGRKRVSGKASPYYRLMVGMGYRPDTSTQPELAEQLPAAPVAHPLPKWWQFLRKRQAHARQPRVAPSEVPNKVAEIRERLKREGRL